MGNRQKWIVGGQDGGTSQISVNPTQVRQEMGHPVQLFQRLIAHLKQSSFRTKNASNSNGNEQSPVPEEQEITPLMIENAKKMDRKVRVLKMLDIEMKF